MGRSQIMGARATFYGFGPVLQGSEKSNVKSGPGEKPADNPSAIPMVRKLIICEVLSPCLCLSTQKVIGNVIHYFVKFQFFKGRVP